MFNYRLSLATCFVAAIILSGCGLSAPKIHEIWDDADSTKQIEFGIKKRVYCDLKRGIQDINHKFGFGLNNRDTGRITKKQFIPDNWGVLVSLSLQVDEGTSINPGLSIREPLASGITRFPAGNVITPQSFSLGLGANVSSTATRTDKFDAYYTVGFLMKKDSDQSVCLEKNDPFLKNNEISSKSSPLIISYLGIEQWLADAMFTNSLLPSDNPAKAAKATDAVTYEIKFVLVSNGNINPTWQLVRFSANVGSLPLFSTGRSRTHSLIVTLGPPKGETSQTHFASQIGQSVAAANRALLLP
jgi:hypothetical protein